MKAIFIDVHGVLLDFLGCLQERIGAIPPHRNDFEFFTGQTPQQFWHSLNQYDFWRNLPDAYFGPHVLTLVREMHVPFYVLTKAMPHSPRAIEGTLDRLCSLSINFEKIVVASDKAVCAHGAFLIDDEEVNCSRWKSHGGTAFQWPCHYNDYLAYGSSTAGYMAALRDLTKQLTHWLCSL